MSIFVFPKAEDSGGGGGGGGESVVDSLLLIKGGQLAKADVQEIDADVLPPVTSGSPLSFSSDGSDFTRVILRNMSNLELFGDLANQSITAATWVKFNALTTGSVLAKRVFSIRAVGSSNNLELYVHSTSSLRGVCKRGSSNTHVESTSITTGVWYHVALTWDHSNSSLTFYLNGASAVASTGTTSASNPSQVGIGLGGRVQTDHNSNIDGLLQDFGIWSKSLSASEVAAIASAGFDLGTDSGSYTSASDLKLWWSIQKRTANQSAVLDSSGGGNIGTFNGNYILSTDVP